MNDRVRPDLLVNLGDDIEDESRDQDLVRYAECQAILKTARRRVLGGTITGASTSALTPACISAVWTAARFAAA